MAHNPTQSVPGHSHQQDGSFAVHRALPDEVPIAITFNGTTQAVMMATPADITDFAHGFALTEGAVTDLAQIERFETVQHDLGIEARFWLTEDRAEALAARRRTMAGPVGCGLCGIDSLDQAARSLPRLPPDGLRLSPALVGQATDQLRASQPLHDQTRATHAAGFLVPGRGVVLTREDVGRHNALDKLIGALLRAGIDPASGACVITSRISVELVQKCAIAGLPVIIAVSAPTAFAVRVADDAGVTLAAFARGGGFETYSHPHRITDEVSHVA
ncbi:formate dehydrogenase accessory sulfurtransferase FdhD [Paracoccus sp. M683]|uniref:formate dehydrogenase accessory sulfurtransferase FdhD n=1 Tax=Paracoccus sp. M683 TaxID=2594268 RepID=UPI00117DA533|nr:formate dehydrogenase accessory sulfurtransferase FdhD [Paracoccus sp. M683]TRW99550.1 formate dehydrogenase accessory sulfurtransferase FdhD [Paracoccus sp. M683]